MHLSRRQKKAIVAVTGLSLIAPLLLFAGDFTSVDSIYPFAAYMVFAAGVTLFYVYYILNSDEQALVGQLRWLWVFVVVFGGAIGQLVFWYLGIWATPKVSSSNTGGELSVPPPGGGEHA